jgi:7-cyano-7-deazaguanine synthase
MSKRKALVILSGGQDSTTCLFYAKREGYEVHAITFDYGQRHNVEIAAARHVARLAGCASHEVCDIGRILRSTSPLVSDETLEQYPNMDALPGGIEKTFVPMRNQMFITIAFNRAIAIGAEAIFTGVCEEDFGGYPDCRLDFVNALEYASNIGTYGKGGGGKLRIYTPLMNLSKASSVQLAHGMPDCWYALGYTHTGYDGHYPPTGKDHASLLRARGFRDANLPDPLVVRAWAEGLMPLPDTANYDELRVEEI